MPYFPQYNKPRYLDEPLAPSKKIIITKYIPPFIKGKDGFGYQGVVSTDKKTGKLQCHTCGKFYEQLPTHYTIAHGMTGNQYKDRYGLTRHTALKSDRLRLIQSQIISDLKSKGLMNIGNKKNKNGKSYGFTKKNKYASNKKGKKTPLEVANKFGRCDDQIKDAVIRLMKKLGKTPTLTDVKAEYGGGLIAVMHSRYGSYIKYCREILRVEPNYSSYNPKYKSKKDRIDTILNKTLKKGFKACKGKKEWPKMNSFLSDTDQTYICRFVPGKMKTYKRKLKALLNK